MRIIYIKKITKYAAEEADAMPQTTMSHTLGTWSAESKGEGDCRRPCEDSCGGSVVLDYSEVCTAASLSGWTKPSGSTKILKQRAVAMG